MFAAHYVCVDTRQSFLSAYAAYFAYAAYSAYCAWALASDSVFVSFALRCLLLVLRFLCFFVSSSSPCSLLASLRLSSLSSSRFLLRAFVVFFVVFASFFASFFRVFFVVLCLSSFVRFVSSSSSDLMLQPFLEDGGLRRSTVFCRLHFVVHVWLPVVLFLLRRRLIFLQSLSSLISEIFQLLCKWPILGHCHRSRRAAMPSSVRAGTGFECTSY